MLSATDCWPHQAHAWLKAHPVASRLTRADRAAAARQHTTATCPPMQRGGGAFVSSVTAGSVRDARWSPYASNALADWRRTCRLLSVSTAAAAKTVTLRNQALISRWCRHAAVARTTTRHARLADGHKSWLGALRQWLRLAVSTHHSSASE